MTDVDLLDPPPCSHAELWPGPLRRSAVPHRTAATQDPRRRWHKPLVGKTTEGRVVEVTLQYDRRQPALLRRAIADGDFEERRVAAGLDQARDYVLRIMATPA